MKRVVPIRLLLVAGLAISLIANVFLVGFIVRGERQARGAGFLAESIAAAYPEEIRAGFRRQLRDNRPRVLTALRDVRDARRTLAAAANATPLDEKAVERAMEDVRTATDALQRLMQDLLLQTLRARQDAGRP
ncbi:periplasmic heavy metal sensor [Chelatococcus sp. XZ-Ab1]|uniref:periplasmic heavy metal sensor n=1 Tax=Chelatococcus sp. XZ-Ab1 TaxID=3034027 RepID=UPI0023E472F7|nr:periplasmic heavy metal sensor [Chelatococcus sp. XZ-Ab1]